MSTIGGGAPVSDFNNISALLEFVKSPEYQDRMQKLKDLEESSRNALAESIKAHGDATAKADALAKDQAVHKAAVGEFEKQRDEHRRRMARIQDALMALQKAMNS
jgi:hypothetical protein